jgi:hypothetical protein
MTIEQYEQLGWSPTTWALLQLGMVLFTVAVIGLFVWMVHRAGEATGPVRTVRPEPAAELQAPAEPTELVSAPDVPDVDPATVDLAGVDSELAHV